MTLSQIGSVPKSMEVWDRRSSVEKKAEVSPLIGSRVLPRSKRLRSSVRRESTGTISMEKLRVSVLRSSNSPSGWRPRPRSLSGFLQPARLSTATRNRKEVRTERMGESDWARKFVQNGRRGAPSSTDGGRR